MRFGIEEVFKDLKAVWGWGKQELRLLESNEAATVMNMVLRLSPKYFVPTQIMVCRGRAVTP